MHILLRWLALLLVRVFYRSISVDGVERLPTSGPAVFVGNHPNGLLDPLVLRVVLGGPLPFLAKSTFFENPFGRLAMRAFDALPAYRQKDNADTSKNEQTFARCRELLARGGRLALFPEGTSHSDPAMRPLRTGAARIVLGADDASDVRLVPVGLLYEDKTIFRSRVSVRIGEPLTPDAGESVEQLTARVRDALARVVVEAESNEIREGIVAVASWTGEDPQVLAGAWRSLVAQEPERASDLAQRARRLHRLLRFAGMKDPFALETRIGPLEVLRFVLPQLLLTPPALVGALLGWLPYRVVGVIAARTKEEDVVSSVKLVGGLVIVGSVYLLEALLAGWLLSWWWAPVVLVAAPLSGLAAIRWQERLELRRELLRGTVLRASGSRLARAVVERREELAGEVRAVLASPVARATNRGA